MAQPHQVLAQFWQQQAIDIHAVDPDRTDFKTHELPLARIKKIMKADEEVDPSGHRFMISAEAPVVFAKACEIFILELTIRAWALTEENKRRTLQRNDISSAIARCDMYDFLIDIVPREEVKQKKMDGSAMHMMDPSHFLFFQQQAPAQALQMQQMFWQQQLAAQQLMMQMQQQQQQVAQQQRQHMTPLHQHGMGDNRDGLGLGNGAGDQLDADASDEDDSDDDDDDQDGDDVS